MNGLKQTGKFFDSKIYELTNNGLKGQNKKLFSSTEYFVDYENIGTRILKKKTGKNGWLTASIIFLVLAVVLFIYRATGGKVDDGTEVFYFIVAIVCGLVFLLTYNKAFYLVQQGNINAIEFIYDKPTKEELDKFIETLTLRRNKVLNEKYGQLNTMLPYDQNHQNLLWLLNNDVIQKNEFEDRIQELNSKFNRPVERKIGFNVGEK